MRWVIDIESRQGIATGARDLERLADALDSATGTTGAAASADARIGAVAATFTIAAPDGVRATELGVAAFREALRSAGLTTDDPTRVSAELVSEPVPA